MLKWQLLLVMVFHFGFGTETDNLEITIRFDYFATDLEVYLINLSSNNEIVWHLIGNSSASNSTKTFRFDLDKDDECWMIYLRDYAEDGLCCAFGYGYFELYLNDKPITLGKQTFGTSYDYVAWCRSLFEFENDESTALTESTDCDFSLSFSLGSSLFFIYILSISDENDYGYIDEINSHSNIRRNIGDKVYENEFENWYSTTTNENSLCISDGCYVIQIDDFCDVPGQYSVRLNHKMLMQNASDSNVKFGFCTSRNYTEWSPTTEKDQSIQCSINEQEIQLAFEFQTSLYGVLDYIYWQMADLSNRAIVTQGGFNDYNNRNKSLLTFESCFEAIITICANLTANGCFSFDLYNYENILQLFALIIDKKYVTFGHESVGYSTKSMYFCANNFASSSTTTTTLTGDSSGDSYNYNLTISITSINSDLTTFQLVTIENITMYENSHDLSDIDIMYSNPVTLETFTNNNVTLSMTNGCYKVKVDTVRAVSDDASGECVVFVNDDIVGYCYNDVASISDSSIIVCTNNNHISHCISPYFCTNDNNISNVYQSEYEIKQSNVGDLLQILSAYGLVNMINQTVGDDIICLAEKSCYNVSFTASQSTLVTDADVASIIFHNCAALRACIDVYYIDEISNVYLNCWAIHACDQKNNSGYSSVISKNVNGLKHGKYTVLEYDQFSIESEGMFGVTNINVMMNDTTSFKGYGYFAFFNVTLVCSPSIQGSHILYIFCDGWEQFIIIDDTCNDEKWTKEYFRCSGLVNKLRKIDSILLDFFNNVTQITTAIESVSAKCDSDDDSNINTNDMVYDIGHSVYSGQSLTNSYSGGIICCRGAYSCGGTTTVSTADGDIVCGGFKSCKDVSFIWSQGTGSNVYCVGEAACSSSAISSSGNVICGSNWSCRESVIFEAIEVFCFSDSSCKNANIQRFEKIYLADYQDGMIIYSGNSENKNIEIFFFYTLDSDITFYCEENDACLIYCDIYSCGNLELYCDGLCNLDCDPENNIYQCDIKIDSPSPTAAPTDVVVLLTEGDVSNVFNWLMGCGAGGAAIVLIAAYINATQKQNELYNWQIVLVAIIYSNDFISDLFFALRLSVVAFDGFTEKNYNHFQAFFLLFVLSVIFVLLPFMVNLFQLNHAIAKWTNDAMLKETCVSHWIASNAKKLYLMTIVTGSSFSAIGLANSYLFKWRAFSMGLSNYHRAEFQTKRFYSVVLLENVPQFGIQLAALILTLQGKGANDKDSTRTSLLITILSMSFTVISILLSAFEYALSRQVNENGTAMIFKFSLESQMVANMSGQRFSRTFVYSNKRSTTHLVSKTLYTYKKQIETLIPLQSNDGAIFTFIIVADAIHFDRMWIEMEQSIINQTFVAKLKSIYNITGQCDIPLDTLHKWTLGSNEDHHKEVELTTIVSALRSMSPTPSHMPTANDGRLVRSQSVLVLSSPRKRTSSADIQG